MTIMIILMMMRMIILTWFFVGSSLHPVYCGPSWRAAGGDGGGGGGLRLLFRWPEE